MDISEALDQWSAGNRDALDTLIPLVADDLRRLAVSHLRRESAAHTLQPSALVNEVYLRLSSQHQVKLESRAQFFALASRFMRRILVDHGRALRSAKRGYDVPRVPLDEARHVEGSARVDLVALNDALIHLETLDARKVWVVKLRFFGGLSVRETAALLKISPATVKRDWVLARAWLQHELVEA